LQLFAAQSVDAVAPGVNWTVPDAHALHAAPPDTVAALVVVPSASRTPSAKAIAAV
jgi:hypothetical protein